MGDEGKEMSGETRVLLDQTHRWIKVVGVVATVALSAMAAGFIVLSIFAGYTLDSERDRLVSLQSRLEDDVKITKEDLRDEIRQSQTEFKSEVDSLERTLKNDIESRLGLTAEEPNVVFLSQAGQELEGQVVAAQLERAEDTKHKIVFSIIIMNKGQGASETLFAKYTYL